MVDFLGIAAVPTDLVALTKWGAGSLPTRMLREDDRSGRLVDSSAEVNRTVKHVSRLGVQTRLELEWRLWFWRRAMRTPAMRAEAPSIMFGDRARDPNVGRQLWRAAVRP